MSDDQGPAERPRADTRTSYAQNMEDILLDRLFAGRPGSFVDVGANHPYIDSNTYYFYLKGWRGVNVEPSPRGHALFAEHRPGDLNLELAVSDAEGTSAFHEIDTVEGLSGLSTLSAEIAETHRAAGYAVKVREVRARTLAAIVAEHKIEPPDFLSIDVEGCEAGVLRGAPFETWKPKVLVIESTTPLSQLPTHLEWEPLVLGHGYLFAATNGINRFYLRGDLADALPRFATPVNALDEYVPQRVRIVERRLGDVERERDWERGEIARERAAIEAERRGWAWGADQARHLQAVWRGECDAFADQRVKWADALAYFEAAQAEFRADRDAWRAEHAGYEAGAARMAEERSRMDAERAAIDAHRREIAAQHAVFDAERAAWGASAVEGARQIAHAQQELRPYKVLDRLRVVPRSYGLARRLARTLSPRRD